MFWEAPVVVARPESTGASPVGEWGNFSAICVYRAGGRSSLGHRRLCPSHPTEDEDEEEKGDFLLYGRTPSHGEQFWHRKVECPLFPCVGHIPRSTQCAGIQGWTPCIMAWMIRKQDEADRGNPRRRWALVTLFIGLRVGTCPDRAHAVMETRAMQ